MDESSLIKFLDELGTKKIKRTNASNVSCSCPFAAWTHGKNGRDDTPSFSMEISTKSRWNCFSCGKRGTSLKSLCKQLSDVCGNSEVFEHWKGFEEGEDCNEKNYSLKLFKNDVQKPKWAWSTTQEKKEVELDWNHFEPMTRLIAPYAMQRGITEEQYKRWKLGWDKEGNRLFIPVFSFFGKFVGYSYRTTLPPCENIPRYQHCRGFLRNNYLYGEHLLNNNHRTCILVEGFMKVWALERVGLYNAFAPMGTTLSDKQLHLIYQHFDTAIIIPDNDEPGVRAARDWESLVKSLGKRVVVSPVLTGKKDLDEWTRTELLFVLNILTKQNSLLRLPLDGEVI